MAKVTPANVSVLSIPGKHTVFFDGAEQYCGATEIHASQYIRKHVNGWPDSYDVGHEQGNEMTCLTTFRRLEEK